MYVKCPTTPPSYAPQSWPSQQRSQLQSCIPTTHLWRTSQNNSRGFAPCAVYAGLLALVKGGDRWACTPSVIGSPFQQ